MFALKSKPYFKIGRLALAIGVTALSAVTGTAQSGGGEDKSADTGDYKITSSIEIGGRFRKVDGSENKFRSDLNYRTGFRVFDSSFLIESKDPKKDLMDSMLIQSSGWGADPSGYTRINAERLGVYRFDSNFRQVRYFNNLNNFAAGQHKHNTSHLFGDFDLKLRPQSEKLRFLVGGSFNRTKGPGTTNGRAYRDDWQADSEYNYRSKDLRAGIEGKVLGFNLGVTQGFRGFTDRTRYFLTEPTLGNNTTDNTRITSWFREFPIDGSSYFTMLNAHRTFAEKVDFTGQYVYSSTSTINPMLEVIIGRDNNNNQIDRDEFRIDGDAKRIQQRGNLGFTFMLTDKFSISETFSWDSFTINGGENLIERVFSRTSAGAPRPDQYINSYAFRTTDYRRYMNLVEGDYQFSKRLSMHVGYKYTDRRATLWGIDRTVTSPTSGTNPLLHEEVENNDTNSVIAGMKMKPMKRWVVYWDVEKGDADNIFTRTGNYKFTNFRVRSRLSLDKIGWSASVITKDNLNPTLTDEAVPRSFGTDVNTRIYSTALDWTPATMFNLSTGYTYTHMTASTAIIVPVGTPRLQGVSRYFIRDNHYYLDATVKPNKYISFFGAYRISKDLGQGDRTANNIENITSSYPMSFQSPEVRVALRIHRNADFNVGYQYFKYGEKFQTLQDYRAHLPSISVRLFFGNPDR
jgi:hypothetical protein